MEAWLVIPLAFSLVTAKLNATHQQLEHLRQNAVVTWKQIDQLLAERERVQISAPERLPQIERKLKYVATHHNKYVKAQNRCLKSVSGRLVGHMRGIRQLNAYRAPAEDRPTSAPNDPTV